MPVARYSQVFARQQADLHLMRLGEDVGVLIMLAHQFAQADRLALQFHLTGKGAPRCMWRLAGRSVSCVARGVMFTEPVPSHGAMNVNALAPRSVWDARQRRWLVRIQAATWREHRVDARVVRQDGPSGR